jgi:hypothetical protein
MSHLGELVSPQPWKGPVVASVGYGRELVIGWIDGQRFSASFYSSRESDVTAWSRVQIVGEIQQTETDGTAWVISIQPRSGGIWVWGLACVASAVGIVIGMVQFARNSYWESLAITLAISLGVLAIVSLTIWWSVHEARMNEIELLRKLEAVGSAGAPEA